MQQLLKLIVAVQVRATELTSKDRGATAARPPGRSIDGDLTDLSARRTAMRMGCEVQATGR